MTTSAIQARPMLEKPLAIPAISTKATRNLIAAALFPAPAPSFTTGLISNGDSSSNINNSIARNKNNEIFGFWKTGNTATASYKVPGSAVGAYVITPLLNDPSHRRSNYEVSLSNGTLLVTPALLTVTAENKSRAYGATNPELTGQVLGIENNDRITANYATSATHTSAVGTYPITPSLNDPDGKLGNYEVKLVNGALRIGKTTLTITAEDKTKVYGSANPPLTYQVRGFVNGEDAGVLSGIPQLTTETTTESHVGQYAINVAQGTLSTSNYDLRVVDGKLTVTPAALTVTADAWIDVWSLEIVNGQWVITFIVASHQPHGRATPI